MGLVQLGLSMFQWWFLLMVHNGYLWLIMVNNEVIMVNNGYNNGYQCLNGGFIMSNDGS